MKISSRADYALSCILRIADKYGKDRHVTVGEIAESEDIASDYVERLCVIMKRSGLLKSIRGKNGGYVLARDPKKISAKDVLLAIDHIVLEPVCFRKKGRRKKCVHIRDCKIRVLWEELKQNMESFLDRESLQDLLIKRRREGNWHKCGGER
ncbi:MAG: Rrf2 family transcriptional regulator [Candidatus Omnitrophica bacterium]|nr:Rrf2 family transcriptional regulator [Candidatus Omnitrophota bacterium]